MVFRYNLNQADDLHGYLKWTFIYTRKEDLAVFWKWNVHSLKAKIYKPYWSLDGTMVGAVILIFSLEVHVLPNPQSHQHIAELWKYAEDTTLRRTLLEKGIQEDMAKKPQANPTEKLEKKPIQKSSAIKDTCTFLQRADRHSLFSNSACCHAVCSVTLFLHMTQCWRSNIKQVVAAGSRKQFATSF